MKNIALFLLLTPFIFSCERLLFEERLESDSPMKNFEYLWKECNEKYSFFELKQINWDEVYIEYKAKIHEDMTSDELFSVLAEMLNELKDGHVNLVSYFNISHYNIEQAGPDNFDWRIIKDNYLPDNYYVSGPFAHDFIADGQIGYIRFPEFSGIVDGNNMEFMLNRYANAAGLILDLRENGGGSPDDIFAILSHFVSEKTKLYESRIKTGPAHNDFSDLRPAMIEPAQDTTFTIKLAVLTDRSSYSASSFFALATKALSNVTLIGDTTGGGLGMPNGGQLPNGWQYRFSISQALDLQGNNYENGVPPDVPVVMNEEDRINGVDPVIERAIVELLN